MKEQNSYHTRQREILLNYLRSIGGAHTTTREIELHFASLGEEIGTTTIYRHLNRLVEEGTVKKFVIDGSSAACFQYVGDGAHDDHYHLKCTSCGKLVHMECDLIGKLRSHVLEDHDFALDLSQTVFYGLCSACRRSA